MSHYIAPLTEIRFVLEAIAHLPEIAALPGYDHAAPDVVDAVLEEAGKFASGVFAPLNRIGDIQGSRLENGSVRTPDGFARRISGACARRLGRPGHLGRIWRAGAAVVGRYRRRRNGACGEHGPRPLPHAYPRRNGITGDARHLGAEGRPTCPNSSPANGPAR